MESHLHLWCAAKMLLCFRLTALTFSIFFACDKVAGGIRCANSILQGELFVYALFFALEEVDMY